ncbi:GtrA family protein [Massilia sp.]|uniref:GtrA family protein n=1 Tax=Massilia sp. TaxID=1882437 RepID=UPI0028AB38C8|nr:GtrA family protein [Massilia sp.]
MKLALVYALLALVATAFNIATQDLVVRIYSGPFPVAVALIVGTGVGLVVKYVLDKRYIFRFRARNAVHDSQTFALYTAMGLATTCIFWGFELGFDYLFETKTMRYAGGVIGLVIGYFAKYYLDKRYVFRTDNA